MYDLDFIVRAELGEPEPVTFCVGEETFTIPAPIDWPDAAITALEAEDIITVVKLLLGDQHEAYEAAGGNSRKFMLLIKAVAESQGVTPGE